MWPFSKDDDDSNHRTPPAPSSSPPPPKWTTEEQDRLNELTKEYQGKVKRQRLDDFKKLPGFMREKIIHALMLEEFVNKFNWVDEGTLKTSEQRDLERKKTMITSNFGNYHGELEFSDVKALIKGYGHDIPTADELLRAHMDIAYAPNGLTIKDEERLRVLENEHEERLKQAKIEKFKSLPKAIREKIVLDIETKRAHCEIDQLSLEPDDELKKLYKKDNRRHGANDFIKSGSAQHFYGIDDDKILEAHVETLLLEDDSGQEK